VFFSEDAIVSTFTNEIGFYSLAYAGAGYVDGLGEIAIVVKRDGYFGSRGQGFSL